jgi:hypothetical protein
VARIYSGALGVLTFLTCLTRGIVHGCAAPSALWTAWCSLLVFAVLGYVIGQVAEWIVADSVRSRIAAELTDTPVAATDGLAPDAAGQ